MDGPEKVMELVEKYPEFRPLYEHIYDMCRNVENVMGLFSKELLELDRNTVQYMIDEMQEEINQKNQALERKDCELARKDQALERKNHELIQQGHELKQKDLRIAELERELQKAKE